MQQDLPQEILQRLDALAMKLGTTAEYLWPALVREASVYGWTKTALLVAATAISAFYGVRVTRCAIKENSKDILDQNVDVAVTSVFAAVGLVVMAGLCAFALPGALASAVAPEAAALRSILPH